MKSEAVKKSKGKLQYMTMTAVMAALITIMTAYVFHIPTGINEGYIHFGDALIYLSAAILPAPYAMAAGAIGGGLADLMTAPVWAPATVIIKMLIILPFGSRGEKVLTKRNAAGLAAAGVISAAGYYLAEGLMFGFHVAFFTSVSGSLIQSCGSAAFFLIAAGTLDRVHFKKRFFI